MHSLSMCLMKTMAKGKESLPESTNVNWPMRLQKMYGKTLRASAAQERVWQGLGMGVTGTQSFDRAIRDVCFLHLYSQGSKYPKQCLIHTKLSIYVQ